MAKASYAQTQYIERLALSAGFRDSDTAVYAAGFTGHLTPNEASALIDRLKSGDLKPSVAEPTEVPEGGLALDEAFSLLGKRVEMVARGVKADGTIIESLTQTVDVESIAIGSRLPGLPMLACRKASTGTVVERYFHLIESYTVL